MISYHANVTARLTNFHVRGRITLHIILSMGWLSSYPSNTADAFKTPAKKTFILPDKYYGTQCISPHGYFGSERHMFPTKNLSFTSIN